MPIEIFEEAHGNLDATYKFRVSEVFKENNFITHLKPALSKRLLLDVLKNYYVHFKEFFWDEAVDFQANDKFIMKFLTSMECQIFLPNSPIIQRGEQIDCIYLIGE